MNRSVAVAFGGRLGAGKSTISTALADDLGWRRVSFGDFVRSVAATRGMQPSRQVLQDIGAELESQDTVAFCRNVLQAGGWNPRESVVIDGIRHARVLDVLRELVAPVPLFFVFLDAESESRKQRLYQRDSIDAESLAVAESHSTEHDVASILPDLADLRVSNDHGSEAELVAHIENQLRMRE
jgi:cytidylate kinase